MKQVFPDYKGGSIVNLSSSIEKALGGRPSYPHLRILPPENLSGTIILIMADGLGYNYLRKHGKGTYMLKHLKGKITAAFPSTSPASSPCFQTGQAPREHGMIGHAIYLKELGGQVRAIRHKPRAGYEFEMKPMSELYGFKPMSERIKAKSYTVLDKKVAGSAFDNALSGNATTASYDGTENMFEKIEQTLKTDKRKKFIFALYSEHDHLAHDYRTKSRKVLQNFKKFDKMLGEFAGRIKNATIIVCADHGMIDIPDKKMIFAGPEIKKMLRFTMSGQQRYLYCHVKKGRKKEFAEYAKKHLKCRIFLPRQIKNYYGMHKPHKNFNSRLGDYILVPKENYAVYDLTQGENKKEYGLNYADHGGFSSDEMLVPLIVAKV